MRHRESSLQRNALALSREVVSALSPLTRSSSSVWTSSPPRTRSSATACRSWRACRAPWCRARRLPRSTSALSAKNSLSATRRSSSSPRGSQPWTWHCSRTLRSRQNSRRASGCASSSTSSSFSSAVLPV